jgi:cytochrome c oxidase assembly protein subunit 15
LNVANPQSPSRIGLLAKASLLATLLAAVVIMLGAWTRLVDAGLGCPDWPGCYGFLTVPQDEARMAIANSRFPETPVDVEKGWPEMIHRYAAGMLGLVVFGLAGYAVRHRREGLPVKLPLFISAFIILQGAFGMWTVTLKLWPQVVALHLLGGFTTISLLTLLTLRLRRMASTSAEPPPGPAASAGGESLRKFRPWLYGGMLLVIMQIALGAWTAANYAAVACTDLPTCEGEWWPAEMDFRHGFDVTQQVGPNYLGGQLTADGRVAIHVTHRVGAVVVLGYFAVFLALLWRRTSGTPMAWHVALVATALAIQILLGLANVIFHIPLSVAIAHNAMGAGLLLTVINLLWRLHRLPVSLSATATKNTIKNDREVTA